MMFPNRTVAWGSVTPRVLPSLSVAPCDSRANVEERATEYVVDVENYWDEEQREQYGCDVDDSVGREKTMTIVPAVNRRLLRVNGAAFHAVPKPPDRYLLSKSEIACFLEEDRKEEDCDDDDHEYWDDGFD